MPTSTSAGRVAYLIDREAIAAQDFWESEQPLDSILALHGLPSDHPWAQYGSDPDRARELLDGLCADLGRDCLAEPPAVVYSTTGNADERPAIGRLIVEMLAAAAIRATVDRGRAHLLRRWLSSTAAAGTWPGGPGWPRPARPECCRPCRCSTRSNRLRPEGRRRCTNLGRWGTPAVSGEISYLNQGPSWVRDAYTARYALLDEMRTTADHDHFAALAREARTSSPTRSSSSLSRPAPR